jgi:hypothetical protein
MPILDPIGWFPKLLQKYHKWKFKGGFIPDLQDTNDYVLGWSFFGSYSPKNIRTNNASKLLEIKDQKGLNICVLVSLIGIKEVDEGCLLDYQWLAAYLRDKKQLSINGTSLSFGQKALQDVGIPQRTREIDCNQDWYSFTDSRQLTPESFKEAAEHKIDSFYSTTSLDKVLEEFDNGRMGHTGADWYSGYNNSGLGVSDVLGVTQTSWWKKILFKLHFKARQLGGVILYIITLNKGYLVGGHAFIAADYDTDYHSFKVIKLINSYSKLYGDNGAFYVKWEDFNKLCKYGVYFNTDLPKNVLGWLSINQGRCVLEQSGNKVYYIDSDTKRYVPDEALMTMLGGTASTLIHDVENILVKVKEGSEMTINDIPMDIREKTKYILQQTKNPNLDLKTLWGRYFPDL